MRGSLGEFFELDIITMVLLGGVSIFGGSGSMLGVVLAIFTVLNIRNGLGLANVDGIIQTGVIGLLLIGSVLIPNLAQRYRAPAPEGESSAWGDRTWALLTNDEREVATAQIETSPRHQQTRGGKG